MKLLLIRHGQSYGDILNTHEGRADYSLTEAGFKQAKDLSLYLQKNYSIDKIFSSPLKRAYQTANKIAQINNLSLQSDERLMEFNNGLLAGITHSFQAKNYPLDGDNDIHPKYKMESTLEFASRVKEFLNDITKYSNQDITIAVVCHGGVYKQIYHQLFNEDINEVVFDTSLSEIDISNDSINVLIKNSNKHLSSNTIDFSRKLLNYKVAYFAGGCFWCMTPMFKIYKADYVLCGYSGGDEINPQYLDVKKQRTGHREAMAVIYDPNLVSYKKLLEIYLANIDPYDSKGQFIDKGYSYTLAIYYTDDQEKDIVLNRIEKLKNSTDKEIYISIEELKNFYEAEEYHQDYYLKNPEAFEKELIESGRKK